MRVIFTLYEGCPESVRTFKIHTFPVLFIVVRHSLQLSASVPLKRALRIFANLTILKTSSLPYVMLQVQYLRETAKLTEVSLKMSRLVFCAVSAR
jgi:hypothetical protein